MITGRFGRRRDSGRRRASDDYLGPSEAALTRTHNGGQADRQKPTAYERASATHPVPSGRKPMPA